MRWCSQSCLNTAHLLRLRYVRSRRQCSIPVSSWVQTGVCRYRVWLPTELRQSAEQTQQDHRRQQRQNTAAEELGYVLETNRSHSGCVHTHLTKVFFFFQFVVLNIICSSSVFTWIGTIESCVCCCRWCRVVSSSALQRSEGSPLSGGLAPDPQGCRCDQRKGQQVQQRPASASVCHLHHLGLNMQLNLTFLQLNSCTISVTCVKCD